MPCLSPGHQVVRAFKTWQYRGGRPQRWARIENRLWAIVFAAGLLNRAATLEVRGRKSGRLISFPVAITEHQGERYLEDFERIAARYPVFHITCPVASHSHG